MTAVYFWQQSLSPHFSPLLDELAKLGFDVVAVHHAELPEARKAMGWTQAALAYCTIHHAPSAAHVRALVDAAPADAIHITQGLARNGLVGVAQAALAKSKRRIWVALETLDASGVRGLAKRIDYAWRVRLGRPPVERFLAIGHSTPAWLESVGVAPAAISPFTYFLPPRHAAGAPRDDAAFRVMFAGTLYPLKRVDDLLESLGGLSGRQISLTIAGDGPSRQDLERQADALGLDATFQGRVTIPEARALMAAHDVLVLPSRHDGWGAVVSEALIEGTRVICSTACGSAGVAQASGAGLTYEAGDVEGLQRALEAMVGQGPVTPEEREATASWARRLTAPAGATYLASLLNDPQTPPPWSQDRAR